MISGTTGNALSGVGVTITLPAGVTVTTDSANAVAELKETDNSLTVPLDIYPNMVDLEVQDLRRELTALKEVGIG